DRNPEWRGKVCFVQVASPSRSIIRAYADVDNEIEQIVADLNRRYATYRWKPAHFLKENFGQPEIYRFYRGADVCIISSLHEGMNLVAKEFVASRDDNRGVLILSQFAGSSRELVDAIIVNPYDEESMCRSLLRALTMGEEEQAARIESMREHVRSHNIFAWAAQILTDCSMLHRRRQLNDLLQGMDGPAKQAGMSADENVVHWPLSGKSIARNS
ncbi:MAG: trehalose-6-phosphate synthase, partial [Xanthobacteraceae bacterium]